MANAAGDRKRSTSPASATSRAAVRTPTAGSPSTGWPAMSAATDRSRFVTTRSWIVALGPWRPPEPVHERGPRDLDLHRRRGHCGSDITRSNPRLPTDQIVTAPPTGAPNLAGLIYMTSHQVW